MQIEHESIADKLQAVHKFNQAPELKDVLDIIHADTVILVNGDTGDVECGYTPAKDEKSLKPYLGRGVKEISTVPEFPGSFRIVLCPEVTEVTDVIEDTSATTRESSDKLRADIMKHINLRDIVWIFVKYYYGTNTFDIKVNYQDENVYFQSTNHLLIDMYGDKLVRTFHMSSSNTLAIELM